MPGRPIHRPTAQLRRNSYKILAISRPLGPVGRSRAELDDVGPPDILPDIARQALRISMHRLCHFESWSRTFLISVNMLELFVLLVILSMLGF